MAGIYIHIPFCKSKCYYCDFYSCTLLAKKQEVLAAIGDELNRRADFLQGETIETIYIGGGTPSLCSPAEIGGLLKRVSELYPSHAIKEITVEVNPDDLSPDYLRALRAEGVDRLSIGVQSFIDRDLRWMHRRHDASAASHAIDNAHNAGFDNLTIDLIYGIPQMSLSEWEYNLQQAFRHGITHLSAYHLTVEPDTAFGRRAARGSFRPVEEQVSEEEFLTVHRTLTGAGYEHYEVSNFARPGFRARHNAAYWHGEKYLGIGPAAHSFDGRERHWNVASVARYIDGEEAEAEQLTEHDRFNEYLLTRLRTAEGICLGELRQRFGAERAERLRREAARWIAAGTLRISSERMAVSPERFLVSDAVIESLFEA